MRDEPGNDAVAPNQDIPEIEPQAPFQPELQQATEPVISQPEAKTLPQPQTAESILGGQPSRFSSTSTEPAAPAFGVVSSTPVEPPVLAPVPSNKRKNIIKTAIIVGALVLLGGGGSGVYAFWYQNPEKAVTDALIHAMSAQSFSGTGLLTTDEKDGYKGKLEITGKSDAEGDAAVAAKLTIDSEEVKTTVTGEGFFSKEGDLFLKVKDAQKLFDEVIGGSASGIDTTPINKVIEKIDDKWIKISTKETKDVLEELRTAQKCFSDIKSLLTTDKEFRKTTLNEVEKLYKNNRFLVISKSLGSRNINGTGSLGYQINTDEEKAKSFFEGLESTSLGKKIIECDEDANLSDFTPEGTKSGDETPDAEVWVSRFGHEITEVKITSVENDTTSIAVLNPVFNRNEEVKVPTESLDISEVLKEFEEAYTEVIRNMYYDEAYDTPTYY